MRQDVGPDPRRAAKIGKQLQLRFLYQGSPMPKGEKSFIPIVLYSVSIVRHIKNNVFCHARLLLERPDDILIREMFEYALMEGQIEFSLLEFQIEHIHLDYFQPFFPITESGFESLDDLTVDIDRSHPVTHIGENFGGGPTAKADFEDPAPGGKSLLDRLDEYLQTDGIGKYVKLIEKPMPAFRIVLLHFPRLSIQAKLW